MDVNTLIIALITAVGLVGGGLWKVYSLISHRLEEKFKSLDEKILKIEKSFDEFKSDYKADMKDLKADLKYLETKVSEMDKQIAIMQVNINHVYLPPVPHMKLPNHEQAKISQKN